MSLAKIDYNDFGGSPVCTHNMPCPVCGKEKAVRLMNNGTYAPCWACQHQGWTLLHVPRWVQKILRKLF